MNDSNGSNYSISNLNPSNSDSSGNNLISQLNLSVESDPNESAVVANEAKPPKVTRKRFDWIKVRECDTFKEAHESLVAEGFKKHQDKQVKDGKKSFYRCAAIKQRSKQQCENKRLIFQDSSKVSFEIFKTECDHTCEKVPKTEKVRTFSKEMKELIVSLHKKRMRPKRIIEHINDLRDKNSLFVNEDSPSIPQVYYIVRAHQGLVSPKILYLGQLIEWCEQNSDVPDDEDKPFVIGFHHSDEIETLNFRIVVSTKRMINHCSGVERLCVDATYKLTWHGYPFMVVGTVDKEKKFHALCFALCVSETGDDFQFIFKTLANAVKLQTNKDFEPHILICDAADSIRNAFSDVFAACMELIVMCYVHVLRNVDKHKEKYDKSNKKEIFEDINALQLAPSREVFDEISKLFLKKWSKREKDFASYFQIEWLNSHSNWFEGAATYTPSTNNSLEGEKV